MPILFRQSLISLPFLSFTPVLPAKQKKIQSQKGAEAQRQPGAKVAAPRQRRNRERRDEQCALPKLEQQQPASSGGIATTRTGRFAATASRCRCIGGFLVLCA
ncbi:hypothetical protein DFJ73DRAFT_863142 [Zopfochytrium polystomum]|nr:hypothetical protein DFJ73DRAFT_863142 [Zopfochytrium polystomum]